MLTHVGLPYSRPERAPPPLMAGALPFKECWGIGDRRRELELRVYATAWDIHEDAVAKANRHYEPARLVVRCWTFR